MILYLLFFWNVRICFLFIHLFFDDFFLTCWTVFLKCFFLNKHDFFVKDSNF